MSIDGKQVKDKTNPTGTAKALFQDGVYRTVSVASDLSLSVIAPSNDQTIPAGYSAVISRSYSIASGKKLVLGLGARFRVL